MNDPEPTREARAADPAAARIEWHVDTAGTVGGDGGTPLHRSVTFVSYQEGMPVASRELSAADLEREVAHLEREGLEVPRPYREALAALGRPTADGE